MMFKVVTTLARRLVDAKASRHSASLCLTLISICLTLPALQRVFPLWVYQYGNPPSWQEGDLDTALIHEGLLQAPRLGDTLQWWVGTWVGQVPFYRPLTSYVFWIEWRLFGDHEVWYGVPTFAAHVLATVLIAQVAWRLAERWRLSSPALVAVMAAAIYTGLTREYRLGVVTAVAGIWKNQPDSLASAGCFLALLAYLGAQDARRVWSAPAVLWYLAACCFKEIAVPLPVICVALELCQPKGVDWRRAIPRAGLVIVCGVLFLLLRRWAIEGTGYVYGSNSRWLDRTLLEFLGPFSQVLIAGYWPGCGIALIAVGVAALAWRGRNFWGRWKFGEAAVVAAAVLFILGAMSGIGMLFLRQDSPDYGQSDDWGLRFAQSILLCQSPAYSSSALSTLFVCATTAALWKRSRAVLWFAPLWTLVFLAPLTFSPGPSHRYYLPQVGYVLFDAVGWSVLLAVVRGWWQSSQPQETSGKTTASAIQ